MCLYFLMLFYLHSQQFTRQRNNWVNSAEQNSKELYFIYGSVLYGFEVRKVTHMAYEWNVYGESPSCENS